MRLVVLSTQYAPETIGIGPYSSDLAEALVQRGHQVRVISSFPFYPEWISRVPSGTFLYRRETVNGVRVTRCRMYVPRRPGLMRRLLHELSWVVSALPVAVGYARWADAWLVVTPAFASALIGACLARFGSIPVHIHIQDLVPDVALESGQMKSRFAFRGVTALARIVYRSFQSASVLSASMGAGLRRYASPKDLRMVVAPNWPRRATGPNGSLPDALRGRSYAVYAGSSGHKQDLALVTQAGALLAAQQGPVIAVLGGGPGHASLRAGSRGLVWLGLVDDATYGAVIANALAGIVALVAGVGNSVLPSKLTGYLAAARPVVVAADPESEAVRVVEEARCGFAVPTGRPEMLAEVLCRIASNPEEAQALGARGRAFAAACWDRERTIDALEGALRDLATD